MHAPDVYKEFKSWKSASVAIIFLYHNLLISNTLDSKSNFMAFPTNTTEFNVLLV